MKAVFVYFSQRVESMIVAWLDKAISVLKRLYRLCVILDRRVVKSYNMKMIPSFFRTLVFLMSL